MFFMMPLSMLIGAIFIRGKERAMLYDHLVHAAYIHAFAFLLLLLFILLVQFTPIKGLIWIIFPFRQNVCLAGDGLRHYSQVMAWVAYTHS